MSLSRYVANTFCRSVICLSLFSSSLSAEIGKGFKTFIDKNKVAALTAPNLKQIQSALTKAAQNPVTNLEALGKYDPTGGIGFCFGRAFATATFLKLLGVKPGNMKSLFIIGDMRSNPKTPEWRFHVTKIVKADNGKWYAIDVISPHQRPMEVKDWIDWVQSTWDSWQGTPKSKFFVTSIDAIMPDVRDFPNGIIGIESDGSNFAFDPATAGLKKSKKASDEFEEKNLWFLTLDQEKKFFLHDHELNGNFDFTGLVINGQVFDFHNYFLDFLNSLENPTRSGAPQPQMRKRSAEGSLSHLPPLGFNPKNLGINL